MIFLFTFVTFNQQTAGLEKKDYSLEWPAYQDERVEGPNISASWTATQLGPQTCFVNKQLTDINKIFAHPDFSPDSEPASLNEHSQKVSSKSGEAFWRKWLFFVSMANLLSNIWTIT